MDHRGLDIFYQRERVSMEGWNFNESEREREFCFLSSVSPNHKNRFEIISGIFCWNVCAEISYKVRSLSYKCHLDCTDQ